MTVRQVVGQRLWTNRGRRKCFNILSSLRSWHKRVIGVDHIRMKTSFRCWQSTFINCCTPPLPNYSPLVPISHTGRLINVSRFTKFLRDYFFLYILKVNVVFVVFFPPRYLTNRHFRKMATNMFWDQFCVIIKIEAVNLPSKKKKKIPHISQSIEIGSHVRTEHI